MRNLRDCRIDVKKYGNCMNAISEIRCSGHEKLETLCRFINVQWKDESYLDVKFAINSSFDWEPNEVQIIFRK